LNLFLTEQWFVDAKKLSVKAKDIVNSKKTNFFPANWSKTYFQWMNNIEHGVSQDNFGGDIKYQHGMGQIKKSSLQ
jgi:valyl-tRNA synthetase